MVPEITFRIIYFPKFIFEIFNSDIHSLIGVIFETTADYLNLQPWLEEWYQSCARHSNRSYS